MKSEHELHLKELVLRYRNGDQKAYKDFLVRVMEIIMPLVKRKIQDEALANDVMQEVLMGIHKSLHTYDEKYSLGPWLFTIARFKVNDHWRSVYKESESIVSSIDIEEDHEVFGHEGQQQASFELKELSQAVENLNEKEQFLVSKIKIEGHSIKSVASELNITESNVKVLTHRAWSKVKNFFEEGR